MRRAGQPFGGARPASACTPPACNPTHPGARVASLAQPLTRAMRTNPCRGTRRPRTRTNPCLWHAPPAHAHTQVREWNIMGLPTDDVSIDNGILVTRGKRWPLMIDPQGQVGARVRHAQAGASFQADSVRTRQALCGLVARAKQGTLLNITKGARPSLSRPQGECGQGWAMSAPGPLEKEAELMGPLWK